MKTIIKLFCIAATLLMLGECSNVSICFFCDPEEEDYTLPPGTKPEKLIGVWKSHNTAGSILLPAPTWNFYRVVKFTSEDGGYIITWYYNQNKTRTEIFSDWTVDSNDTLWMQNIENKKRWSCGELELTDEYAIFSHEKYYRAE